ncbi:MAG TPA: hypothetical protein VJ725_08480, partial [Thermoanaerobaculia bacterium]|nr:hypothetical protein [Thermoanaerobaculia bacterium]
MECLTAAVLVVAVVVLVLGIRRSKGSELLDEQRRRETETLRAVVSRLQERVAELERLAGVRPGVVPPPPPHSVPVSPPPVEAAVVPSPTTPPPVTAPLPPPAPP